MGNFDRNNRRPSGGGFNRNSGGRNSFGGSSRGGRRDGERPSMHRATCDECGSSCEIPFKPTQGKPVYCSDCFGKQNDRGGRSNSFSDRRPQRDRFEDKQMFDATCDKCGNDCQVPFRPTSGKPLFCDNCFGKDKDRGKMGSRTSGSGEVMEEIKKLNSKVDRLIALLDPKASIKKDAKKEVKKEVKAKKDTKSKTKVADKKAVKKTTKKVVKKAVKAKKTAPAKKKAVTKKKTSKK